MQGKRDISHSDRQKYSGIILWLGLIFVSLLSVAAMESICLGILYVNNTLRGINHGEFAREHLLTKPFASTPAAPVAGKHFLGYLESSFVWEQFLHADVLLGWRLSPESSALYKNDKNPLLEYLYITDSNGFVADVDDPPVPLQKPADAYRVIVLGGSTVMGEGAPRPSQNIVGMLRKVVHQRRLTGPNGKRIELINAGVIGYNSAQEYLYFISDLLPFKPDLVIAYDGGVDSQPLDHDQNWSPFRTNAHHIIAERLTQSYSIKGLSRLFVETMGQSLAEGNFKVGMVELPWRIFLKFSSLTKKDVAHSQSIRFDPQNLEAYDRSRRAFLALGDDKLSVALFLNPIAGVDGRSLSAEETAAWWKPALQESLVYRVPFYEGARRILADLKAKNQRRSRDCIADLSNSLADISESVYVDSGHLSPKGNEIVAIHMLDELISCGLLR